MSLALSPMYLSTMALETTLRKLASSCLATARASSVLPVPTRRREGGREKGRREGEERGSEGEGEERGKKMSKGIYSQQYNMINHLAGHRGDILWEE